VPESESWMEKLEKIEYIKEAALFGNSIHVVVADAAAAVPEIKKMIKEGGVKDFTAKRIEPTLEDVFVALIENYDEGNHINESPKS